MSVISLYQRPVTDVRLNSAHPMPPTQSKLVRHSSGQSRPQEQRYVAMTRLLEASIEIVDPGSEERPTLRPEGGCGQLAARDFAVTRPPARVADGGRLRSVRRNRRDDGSRPPTISRYRCPGRAFGARGLAVRPGTVEKPG